MIILAVAALTLLSANLIIQIAGWILVPGSMYWLGLVSQHQAFAVIDNLKIWNKAKTDFSDRNQEDSQIIDIVLPQKTIIELLEEETSSIEEEAIARSSMDTWLSGQLTPTAITTDGSAQISGIVEKTTLTDEDLFLIEDSADSYSKKKVKKSNVGGGAPGGATKYNKTILTQDWTPYSGNYYYLWTHGLTLSPWYNFLLNAFEPTLGSEMNSDPTIETDTWTKNSWTYSSTRYNSSAQSTDLAGGSTITAPTASKVYLVTYDVANYSAGTVTPNIGSTAGTARSANGTYTDIITAADTTKLKFVASSFTGAIDNVYIKELTGFRGVQLSDLEIVSTTQIKIWSPSTDPLFLTLL